MLEHDFTLQKALTAKTKMAFAVGIYRALFIYVVNSSCESIEVLFSSSSLHFLSEKKNNLKCHHFQAQ